MMLSNRGSAGAGGSGVTQNEHSDQITNTQKASFIRTPPDCLSPPILCKHMATLFYRSPDVNQDKAISPRQWEEGRNSLLSELGTCTHWDLWGKKKSRRRKGIGSCRMLLTWTVKYEPARDTIKFWILIVFWLSTSEGQVLSIRTLQLEQ